MLIWLDVVMAGGYVKGKMSSSTEPPPETFTSEMTGLSFVFKDSSKTTASTNMEMDGDFGVCYSILPLDF